MSKFIFLLAIALIANACGNAARPVASNAPAAGNGTPERSETAIAHGPKEQVPGGDNSGAKSKWSQGGEPIDTAAFDAEIAKAEKASAGKTDAASKKSVSDAYLKRADALTQARQYASALGDYRRALKADPSNAEAKQWIEQITSIYDSMNKEAPPEGQEPQPLPFKKGN
ncbi:MAG: hypothetical protein JO053_09620 [Acidobacteria bacterium]|nr:hypothetical protein [Acidobacteriota bacterium]